MARLLKMLKDYDAEQLGGGTVSYKQGSQQKFRSEELTDKLLSEGYAEETGPKRKSRKKPAKSETKAMPEATPEKTDQSDKE